MLAGGHCQGEKSGGDSCPPHSLVVFKTKSMTASEMQSFHFLGSVLDIKVVQAQAIIMVLHSSGDMDLKATRQCQKPPNEHLGGEGYLYFYQCTKRRWSPIFLARSAKPVSLDLSKPIKHQWSITASKIAYRISALQIGEAPMYWADPQPRHKIHDVPNDTLALGSHGDLYVSSKSSVTRITTISLRRERRIKPIQTIVR